MLFFTIKTNIKSAILSQAKGIGIFERELSWTNIYTLLYQVSLDSSQSKIISVQLFGVNYIYEYMYLPIQT